MVEIPCAWMIRLGCGSVWGGSRNNSQRSTGHSRSGSSAATSTRSVEFSRNTQNWQHWHFCTNSNGNILETVENGINFNANWYLPWCFEFIMKWLISLSYSFSKNEQYKNACVANFVYYGKTRVKLQDYSNETQCSILVCTVLQYPALANVNTCPHSCSPLGLLNTCYMMYCTTQGLTGMGTQLVYAPYVYWKMGVEIRKRKWLSYFWGLCTRSSTELSNYI